MSQIEAFNALTDERAEADLLACCAAPGWARAVAAGRPYPDLAAVLAAADTAGTALSWAEVTQALAAHPRIGQRPTGQGREDGWSKGEQSGMDGASVATRIAIAEANEAYEQRFGYRYLICATGRTDLELLAAAQARLTNDEQTEQAVVRAELGRIAALRIRKLLDERG